MGEGKIAPEYRFPDPQDALTDPNGLLATGGDLSPGRLVAAYQQGIFPWYSSGQPILWWSPDPRMVLFPEHLKVSRSLKKVLRQGIYTVTADTAFVRVIQACAMPRAVQQGTWITEEMIAAYTALYGWGVAHSVEVWYQGVLVGGLYGLHLGYLFFGESMFSQMDNASKVALVYLVAFLRRQGVVLIDCQQETKHLASLGAAPVPRTQFLDYVYRYGQEERPKMSWTNSMREISSRTFEELF